ncbi:hypothetical protein OVS_04335 [Mycoplasma ovis str. Michigan]|uniref:Uncharacterized protein n=2 Tax=Mycoplasma ovis TaxID=171632 RepID=A0ABM5P2E8_9MOLU|nr:hypothetical protein OVS_04335 [Mycoplasma ovis str. Michigan]
MGKYPIYYFWDWEETENSNPAHRSKSKVDLYQWDSNAKIFTLAKEKQELTIWKWWGRGKALGNGYDLQYFYKFAEDQFLNPYLENYLWTQYDTYRSSSLSWTGKNKSSPERSLLESVYVGQWRVIKLDKETAKCIPFLNKSSNDISREQSQNIQLARTIYWSSKPKDFAEGPKESSASQDITEIKTYKEYLDFLGLKQNNSQDGVVSKELEASVLVEKRLGNPDNVLFMNAILDKLDVYQDNNPVYYFWNWEELDDQNWRGRKSAKALVNLYKWDSKAKIFSLAQAKQELTVWKWKGKGSYWSGGYDMNYFYKFVNDKFTNNNLEEYYKSGYQLDDLPSLSWWLNDPGKHASRRNFENYSYLGKWKVMKLDWGANGVIPAINYSLKDITEENLESISLARPIYWSNKSKSLGIFHGDDTIEIKNYKQYLDFLGLKWDNTQKTVVSKESVIKKS